MDADQWLEGYIAALDEVFEFLNNSPYIMATELADALDLSPELRKRYHVEKEDET